MVPRFGSNPVDDGARAVSLQWLRSHCSVSVVTLLHPELWSELREFAGDAVAQALRTEMLFYFAAAALRGAYGHNSYDYCRGNSPALDLGDPQHL